MSTPKDKHVTRTSARCQDSKGMATEVSVQLTREEIRAGEQAQLEAESFGPGVSSDGIGSSQRAPMQVRHHRQVLFCVMGRTDFAEYLLSVRPRLGLAMHFKKQPPHSF